MYNTSAIFYTISGVYSHYSGKLDNKFNILWYLINTKHVSSVYTNDYTAVNADKMTY